jgi:tryptophan synthase alpha chain
MNRIEETFRRLQTERKAAFMPYLVAGDPDLDTTRRLIVEMEKNGADLIELGIPFSDPMADGPTNQLAAMRALKNGATLAKTLEMLSALRQETQIPIMLMGYYNPFYHYGLEKFCLDAAAAGADGLIIPDLQPDAAGEIRDFADASGLATVFLIAPTSTDERLKLVGRESRGFVYAVSLTGVTGARSALPGELTAFIERARKLISLPIAVGFGIGTPEMAQAVGKIADGVIVGSAIVKIIQHSVEAGNDPVIQVGEMVAKMAAAVKRR